MKTLSLTSVTVAHATNIAGVSGQLSDGDTVTIDSKVYTFRNTVTTEGDVKIGSDKYETTRNWKAAVNHDGNAGVDYVCAAKHPTVWAYFEPTDPDIVNFRARAIGTAGNSIAVATSTGNITWDDSTFGGGSDTVTVAMSLSDVTYGSVGQRMTVADVPEDVPTFIRAVQLTDLGLFCKRNGQNSVAMELAAFTRAAAEVENGLSPAPVYNTSPSSASLNFAVSNLTSDATNVSDGDQVVYGSKTYTFKTALTPTEGQVLIGADAGESLQNLYDAINHTGTPGTQYSCAAANADVQASDVTATTLTVYAKEAGTGGNSLASTTTAAHLSFVNATLTGATGSDSVDFTVDVASELSGVRYEWYVSTNGGTTYSLVTDGGIYDGASTDTLTVTPTNTGLNDALYKSVALSDAGITESSTATLTLTQATEEVME